MEGHSLTGVKQNAHNFYITKKIISVFTEKFQKEDEQVLKLNIIEYRELGKGEAGGGVVPNT